MTRAKRKFEIKAGPRGRLPLKIILISPPGTGKTQTAIELATGMSRVLGKRVVVGDTEYPRSRFFLGSDAGGYDFDPVPIDPPYEPLVAQDFLEAFRDTHVCVLDSLSDLHEGEGGVIDMVTRMIDERGEKYSQQAWCKVKTQHVQKLRNYLQTYAGDCVFTVRAKPEFTLKKSGRTKWETICGYEYLYISTLNIVMLDPGVPMLDADRVASEMMVKVPGCLRPILEARRTLDARAGEDLARWALGDARPPVQPDERAELLGEIKDVMRDRQMNARTDPIGFQVELHRCFGIVAAASMHHCDMDALMRGLELLRQSPTDVPTVPYSDVVEMCTAADDATTPDAIEKIARVLDEWRPKLTESQHAVILDHIESARKRFQ